MDGSLLPGCRERTDRDARVVHEFSSAPDPFKRTIRYATAGHAVNHTERRANSLANCANDALTHRAGRDRRGADVRGISIADRVLAGPQRRCRGERRGVAGNLESRLPALQDPWLGNTAIPQSN